MWGRLLILLRSMQLSGTCGEIPLRGSWCLGLYLTHDKCSLTVESRAELLETCRQILTLAIPHGQDISRCIFASVDTYLDRSDLKFYSMGQSDSAETNEKYSGEFYDTLLFNLSAPPRSVNPRYAKVQLDEPEFDFSRAHVDRDFLYQPQQAELFASPAGSWSDVHIGIHFQ
jgi:hypothetical protein